ncbi:hypothetical protein JVT61DRAFT_8829 [Boletus reticuloceps]|uniref:CxC1-like cysteine cluster associated with KDZ transposases domain-containing protein n=1 Tax=Boletus reticuloceps TaxID=495285 RepID=A0A8I2YHI6_9AGAM|nr:hypothetical protein JVT61DRAFT_8829 [Boletus reticuloceps]
MPRHSTRIQGLSKSIAVHSVRRSLRQTKILHARDQARQRKEADEQRAADIQSINFLIGLVSRAHASTLVVLPVEDRDLVERMMEDHGVDLDYVVLDDEHIDSDEKAWDTDDEEEDEFAGLSQGFSGRRSTDSRDRRDRIELQTAHWAAQMPRLVDAYLEYRSRDLGDGFPSLDEIVPPLDLPSGTLSSIELVDLFAAPPCISHREVRRTATLVARPQHLFPNENLIYHGYLGTSPVSPTVAISIRTLAAFRQAHRACPRFTIQAQCKVLCHLHNVPYRPYLCTQLTAAFDAYLEIIHNVEQRIQKVLESNSQEWRLRNECPACFYRLEDEPPLTFDWLVSIDGNNSLKRWDTTVYGTMPREDSRIARSTYWLSDEAVDNANVDVYGDDDWETVEPDAGLPDIFNCVDRWRNARSDVRKKTFSVFKESGIFIATCRHRFVLLACDMIKSGELAKYPLTIMSRLLSVYGPNGACAYDIGCAFASTINNSSLAAKVQELNLRFMVGAFHGHAHNRLCQLNWHPMYIEGTGNTEGEGCEHVFSASNELARGTRHASRFHRHQAIEQHFAFWNADKYEALTRFIRNHYREATESVRTLTAELAIVKNALNLTDDDFPRFIAEERAYLTSLKQRPQQDPLKIHGVAAGDYNTLTKAINTAQTRVNLAYAMLQHTEKMAAQIQIRLGLESRWEIGGAEYLYYKDEATLGKYREALHEVERLVVMRLFELSKLSMSGTGYKMRQQISKGLQRRSAAIRKAINRYNTLAATISPPRPSVSWKDITKYTFLGEFDILCHSRVDIRDREWAKPAIREATAKFFKLCRAKEEITRLAVETRRLRTAIHDEEKKNSSVTASLLETEPLLARELERLHRPRAAVNSIHLHRLDQIRKRYGCAGNINIRSQASPVTDMNTTPDGGCVEDEEPVLRDEPSQETESSYDLSDLFKLYINDPGDADMVDNEDETAGLQAMADFLYDIVD